MKKQLAQISLVFLMLCVMHLPVRASTMDTEKNSFSNKEMMLRINMRASFGNYLTWQRIFVLETLTGSPDSAKAQTRLGACQDDICGVFKTYFGDYTGNQLSDLFKQYNQLIADYTVATKNRTGKSFVGSNTMYDKSDEMATLLSNANMNWSKDELSAMFKKFTDSIVAEIDGQGNQPGVIDTAAIDATSSECLDMADTLTYGLIKQFPSKFW
jgi:hypothetical protein